MTQHFEPAIAGMIRGLSIQYFENRHELPVYDKNRKFATGGAGAMVIAANGASLKPGKVQNGFIRRRRQDADHLHRTRDDAFGGTYRHCLKFAVVLAALARVFAAGQKLVPVEAVTENRITFLAVLATSFIVQVATNSALEEHRDALVDEFVWLLDCYHEGLLSAAVRPVGHHGGEAPGCPPNA